TATSRFIDRVEEIKAVRRQRKNVALVANRMRTGSRAAERLEAFFRDLGHEPAGRIVERALYSELADRGLSLFDIDTRQAYELALPWLPLLEFLEKAMRGR
ncbi:MAG: ParA family protein, partial [Enhydrobacter sp.]|nr:ParA family protein [Enhydrobacter sp.]